jgi:penicillin-binding protein 2
MNAKLPLFHKGDSGNMDFSARSRVQTNTMLYLFFVAIGIFFLILISRLFQLTVVKGNYYRSLSEQNRIREVVVEAQRGKIIDRKGYVLAENSPVEVNESLKRIVSKRYYKDGSDFGNILGYRQIADQNDVDNDPCINKIHPGDKVGKKGVEKLFECDLRGRNGKKLIEVNAQGLFKRTLNVVEPEHGKTVQLSIDGDLQKRADELLLGKRGAVVGVNPNTGEVLIMASSPSYDPQVFEDNKSEEIQRLLKDSDKPLFNRASEGIYPPGSVFKMIVAVGALQENSIEKDTIVEDTGKVKLGQQEFGTWNFLEHGQVEGDIDVIKAIQRSNDIFFYKIGEKIGPEKMKSWAEQFGYQSKTGIGIDEAMGTIPSPFWKQDVLKEQWYTGDTYNFSIGQGFVLATPLQVALSVVPFANEGDYCSPSLVKMGTPLSTGKHCKKLKIDKENMDLVREGMKQACQVGGTGWPMFTFRVKNPDAPTPTPTKVASGSADLAKEPLPSPTVMPIEKLWDASYLLATSSAMMQATKPVTVGCKTGTAESPGGGKPHAWFTIFAPYDNPEIVLSILVEEDGQGSDRAAPIARELLRQYFETQE